MRVILLFWWENYERGCCLKNVKKGDDMYGLVGIKYMEDLVIVINKSDLFKFYEKEK